MSLAGLGGTATATYRLHSNGQAYRTNLNGTLVSINGEWRVSGDTSLFEAYATWTGTGGSVGGTTGSWVNLGTTRDWTLTVANSYQTRSLNLQIRLASSGAVLDTATIYFEVDSAQ